MGLEGGLNKPKRLSVDEAQQEAGMLSAHLELTDVKDATSEDYDQALEAIEEMRQVAESEPALKVEDIVARFKQRSKFALQMLSAVASSHGGSPMLVSKAMNDHEKAMYNLNSAAEKLKALRDKASE